MTMGSIAYLLYVVERPVHRAAIILTRSPRLEALLANAISRTKLSRHAEEDVSAY